jgi:alpha-L-fucosidase
MRKWLQRIIVLVFAGMIWGTIAAQQYQPTWESLDKRPVPEWFKNAKFGIFITWGVYSVPAWSPKGQYSEWYQYWLQSNAFNGQVAAYHRRNFGSQTYYELANSFKADLYNPDEWAQLFEKAGARYIVAVAKHHDGFCWWPSKEADQTWGFPWNAMEVGPHRDLLGELFTAVRKTSVKPGVYCSLYEWYNPLYLKDPEQYTMRHLMPQLKDLINTYKPDVLWTDGDWDQSDSTWHSTDFLDWLYNDSPVKTR